MSYTASIMSNMTLFIPYSNWHTVYSLNRETYMSQLSSVTDTKNNNE